MKYLFFDIECSNCFNGKGKVCEFGYVITDENFKIISAQDIPMSPGKGRGNRFHLRDRMAVEDVKLAYDEAYYYEQPELPAFYERSGIGKNLVDSAFLHKARLQHQPFK